ncbi:hypothetical protein WA026_015771 [Henosepilachna vigintioctopunctata]|uniref:C2H2-type domain-containing protein n=1 Tax=Henosepilachna vigintioctopunctata TaxID=420089 RepID=A0AAW1UYM8_9CUCU
MTEKPFACTEDNCNMKFTNEDHLNSHQKKHTMSFNLEICTKNNETAIMVSDETPTPTSFFRNCEEVGLFQDLQNVNPFEETFKKALQSCENGASKQDSLTTSEDTLHTPHVFPVPDEAPGKNVMNDNNELSIMNFVEIPQLNDKLEFIPELDSNMKVREKQENFRHKLKEALLRKDRRKYFDSENSLPIDLPQPPNFVVIDEVIYANEKDNNKNVNSPVVTDMKKACEKLGTSSSQKSSIEKVREMNRAAQMRCRDKKKRYYDRVTKELSQLKNENIHLRRENARLRQHTITLWKTIEELGGIQESQADILDVELVKEITAQEVNPRKLPVLAPAGKVLLSKNESIQQPVIYNLVPVQVLNIVPNSTEKIPLTTIPKIVGETKSSKLLPRILKRP